MVLLFGVTGNLQSWHLALVQELHRRYNAALSGQWTVVDILWLHCGVFHWIFLDGDASRWSQMVTPGCQVYSYVREMTDEEILQLWEQKKTDAANRGTVPGSERLTTLEVHEGCWRLVCSATTQEAHYQIELWLNRDHCRVEESSTLKEKNDSMMFYKLSACRNR